MAMRTKLVDTGKKDHATDALLAALTGLIFLGALNAWIAINPDGDQANDAGAEGWIFFPQEQPREIKS